MSCMIFFFNDTATTEIYTLSLHDALPISRARAGRVHRSGREHGQRSARQVPALRAQRLGVRGVAAAGLQVVHQRPDDRARPRSEEHTSELQSRQYLVCRLLLEKKNYTQLL